MTLRYCARCGTEVEDTGGYCLLGHPLRLHAPTDSLTNLRAEVDAAFEQARVQVAHALAPTRPTGEGAARASAPPPPPPPPPPASSGNGRSKGPWAALDDHTAIADDPIAAFAPSPRMDWGPEKSGLKLPKRR